MIFLNFFLRILFVKYEPAVCYCLRVIKDENWLKIKGGKLGDKAYLQEETCNCKKFNPILLSVQRGIYTFFFNQQ